MINNNNKKKMFLRLKLTEMFYTQPAKSVAPEKSVARDAKIFTSHKA